MLTPAQYRERIRPLAKQELERAHRYWLEMKAKTPDHRISVVKSIDSFIRVVEEARYEKDPDYRHWRDSLSKPPGGRQQP